MTSQAPSPEANPYLPGLELEGTISPPTWQVDKGMAIARMLTAASVGVLPEAYESVSSEALVEAGPGMLFRSLVGHGVQVSSRKDSRPSNGYLVASENGTYVAVALNYEEAKLVPHFPAAHGRAAYDTVRRARKLQHSDEAEAAAKRSIVHTLEPKVARMEQYRDKTLVPQAVTLDRTIEALQHPGFKRFKDEAEMRMRFTEIRGMIDDAIQAAAEQRGWNRQQQEEVLRAVEKRMLFDRKDNKHLHYTSMLLTMLRTYNAHKQALITGRIGDCQQVIASATDA